MASFDERVKFGFGKKHSDKYIEDVPDSYLDWVLGNCNNIPDDLRGF